MSKIKISEKFDLGEVIIAAAAESLISQEDYMAALDRHKDCDWGDVPEADWQQNNEHVKSKGMINSVYYDSAGTKFLIITDPRHNVTSVLTMDDY